MQLACTTIQTPAVSDQVAFSHKAINTVTGLHACLACLYLGYASEDAAEQRSARGLVRQAQWRRLQPGAHTADPLFRPGLCHHCDAAIGQVFPQAAGWHVHHQADIGQAHFHAAAAQEHCLADSQQVAPCE